MTPAEARAREICHKVHGNDSLWELYLEDARRDLWRRGGGLTPRRPRSAQRPVAPQDWQMPFGKHKGESLGNLPIGYLRWLYEATDVDPDLRAAVESVLEER